jgi:hypothetical protein
MRTLSQEELHFVNGGYELLGNTPISGIFFLASLTSIIGGGLGAVIYYETLPSVFIQNSILSTMNVNLITLPVAVFAGFGIGGLLGTTIGLGMYFGGMLTPPE